MQLRIRVMALTNLVIVLLSSHPSGRSALTAKLPWPQFHVQER